MQPTIETGPGGITPLPDGCCTSLRAGQVPGQLVLLQGLPLGSGQSVLQAACSRNGNHTHSQFPFTSNAVLKCPYFLYNTIVSVSSIKKKARKENCRPLINTGILGFFYKREIQNKFTCFISLLSACILHFSCGCAGTLQSVSLMNIDSSSRWEVAYLHPLHLCGKFITSLCYGERLLEGGQNT